MAQSSKLLATENKESVAGSSSNLASLLKMAILSGLAAVLMLTVELPLLPMAPFLTYDFSDIPALIAGFALGPWYGLGTICLKNTIFLMLRFSPQQIIGVPMNTIAGFFLVGVSAYIYNRNKTKKRARLSLVAGAAAMTLFMIPVNIVCYPLFAWLVAGESKPDLTMFVLTVVAPFNIFKSSLSCIITYFIYKRLSAVLKW